ncbi:helix-turn-helix transcriptional regulator [Fulvimonas yonginensis]|uniref:Helix-turn-helix transcriptional regulator n=1 Tax=Fulvimonas yonginensis TaxID=1495200 RepID=A0ABU8JC46_9GAMM
MNHPTPISSAETGNTFADRIKLLIQRVGSATEIARLCGFSEGVVRSWRDGHTDPSRARCVKLARTLGISLVWLVAGEGPIVPGKDQGSGEEQLTTETARRLKVRLNGVAGHSLIPHGPGVDSQRLNAAMRILQSELDLADSNLSLADNTDLLADLYEALGPGGVRVDTSAMLAFNRQLSERIHRARTAPGSHALTESA